MYYAGEPYDSVLAQFKALLDEPEFFVRLTGEQGCGKSALLEQAVQYYQQQGYLTRYFAANPDSPMALRSALRKSFDLPKTHNFQRNLQEYLSNQALKHKGIVLIFDECHLMNNATLLEVTKLTDIQISNSCMLSIIMCGADKLDERLNRDHELRPVLQRITLSSHLSPLDKKGTALFLQTLFDNANQQNLVFEPPALALLFDVSKGLPQHLVEIGRLCSNLYRSHELSTPVSKAGLLQVLKHPSLAMRRYTNRQPVRRMRIAAAGVAAIMLVAVVTTAWLTLRSSPAERSPDTMLAIADSPSPQPENQALEVSSVERAVVVADEQPRVVDSTETLPPLSQDILPPLSDVTMISAETSVADAGAELEPMSVAMPETTTATVAQQLQTTAAPTVVTNASDSAEQALQNWLAAWQARDVDGYLSFYHMDFFPRGFDSLNAWQENRRRNIGNREWIALQISGLTINNIAERTTQLEFWLDYQSPGYSDRTQKQVLMRLGDQGWQIVQEMNLEIIYL